MTNNVQLSLVRPDFASIREQLEATIASYNSWRDLLPTGTGRTITDWISAIGANDQYAIEHAFREGFRTARLDSSIMAQVILLGVRLDRKTPCSVRVRMSVSALTGSYVIPAYTQFTGGSGLLFNRNAITVTATPTEFTLYEGRVVQRQQQGDGSAYQMFVTEDNEFTVSNKDVVVALNNVILTRTVQGLWHRQDVEGYQDTTSATGQMLLTFGGENYGTQPQTSDSIVITYALTRGSSGQNAAAIGQKVQISGYSGLTAVCTTGLSGGGDERNPTFYRKLGGQLFAAKSGATTQDEYSAVATSYPGVIDAKVLGQRDIAPGDVRWMNMVQVSLLTNVPWTGAQWDTFVKWFQQRSIFPVRLYRKDPVPQPVDIDLVIYCQGRADLAAVEAAARAQITKLFEPRPGIIDNNIYLSDIHAASRGGESAIEYADINSPLIDVVVHATSPSQLTLTLQTGGAVLPAAQYTYGVTAVLPGGETLATNFTSIVANGSSSVRIGWEAVPGATGYNVYGRDGIAVGLIGTTSALFFVDPGLSVAPSTNVPQANSSGHRYPKLGTLTVKAEYTNRGFYNLGSLK